MEKRNEPNQQEVSTIPLSQRFSFSQVPMPNPVYLHVLIIFLCICFVFTIVYANCIRRKQKQITFCKIFPRISLINLDLLFVAQILFYSKKNSHLGKACKQQLFLIVDVSLYGLQYFFFKWDQNIELGSKISRIFSVGKFETEDMLQCYSLQNYFRFYHKHLLSKNYYRTIFQIVSNFKRLRIQIHNSFFFFY